MPKIEISQRLSRRDIEDTPSLSKELDVVFEKHAEAINQKPDLVSRTANPTVNDFEFSNGTLWLNTTAGTAFILITHPTNLTATWYAL